MANRKVLTLFVLLTTLFAISAFAVDMMQRPRIKELETNREYVELFERDSTLSAKADSVNKMLAECRGLMNSGDEGVDVEALRAQIIALEQQAHDISIEQGTITRRIGSIEQEHIMQQILAQQQHAVVGEIIDDTAETLDQSTHVANLVDNDCFKKELAPNDYADLLRAQGEETIMVEYVKQYITKYEMLSKVAQDYSKADRASVADPLYKQYEQISKELAQLDEDMTTTWNHIVWNVRQICSPTVVFVGC